MASSSNGSAARLRCRKLYRASAPFTFLGMVLSAGLLASCASLAGASLGTEETTGKNDRGGAGGWSGAGGSFSEGVTVGGSVDVSKPSSTTNGSYSYLCGGSRAECMPGTGDCTPGGNPNMNSDAGTVESVRACQLTAEGGEVVATCAEAGTLKSGDPCQNATYCSATLGCVATSTGGKICRPYCCDDIELCPADTYCAPIEMAEAPLKIPVCTPVKKCKLLDDSTCDAGQVCTIVRSAGTTSCVDVGPGKRDEPCPCASGYVCSRITSTCLKLCHIGNDAVDCAGGGTCQGGVTGYPEGVGICVAFTASR